MSNVDSTKFFLSRNWLVGVSIYYFACFSTGIFATVHTILYPVCPANPLVPLVVGGIGMSLIGSGVYYMRKIYKACLSDGLDLTAGQETFLMRLGSLIYLIARPLFGVGFALLVIVGLKAGIVTIVKGDSETTEGLVFITMFFCFFAGFAAGRVLNRLDDRSRTIANQVIE